jgi:hypothetical protein
MPKRLVPYKHNSYTDILLAAGTAHLACTLYGFDEHEVRMEAMPSGIEIQHPEPTSKTGSVPFQQIRDKESRDVDEARPLRWDKTRVDDDDPKPRWWTTVSVINTLARPDFNNRFAKLYTPELGEKLLKEMADFKTRSRSQLLYAQASKGVNKSGFTSIATSQGNIGADEEQMLALLGYQVGGAGYIRGSYTISIVPRPGSISLQGYRWLIDEFLRGYTPKATSGKPLPTREQTVPFFLAMAYFDFIIELFDYRGETDDYGLNLSPGEVISGLDRAMYFSMGTSSAPFALDTLAIPEWLDEKKVAVDVRNLIREMLGTHTDPNLLYLPVRAFTESDPRPLVEFYREYEPMRTPSSSRSSKRLIRQTTLSYVMKQTHYEDLDCDAMRNFAQAIRSRTLSKLYHDEQPDYDLLTKLRSASRNPDRLVSMLSDFVGSYNLHNARQTAVDKNPDGKNLRYEDLQEIRTLIAKYDAEFVANTLMAQAMSKASDDPAQEDAEKENAATT